MSSSIRQFDSYSFSSLLYSRRAAFTSAATARTWSRAASSSDSRSSAYDVRIGPTESPGGGVAQVGAIAEAPEAAHAEADHLRMQAFRHPPIARIAQRLASFAGSGQESADQLDAPCASASLEHSQQLPSRSRLSGGYQQIDQEGRAEAAQSQFARDSPGGGLRIPLGDPGSVSGLGPSREARLGEGAIAHASDPHFGLAAAPERVEARIVEAAGRNA